jgi:general secretion pathway protein K
MVRQTTVGSGRNGSSNWCRSEGARGSALLLVLPLLGIVAALVAVAARAVSSAAFEMNAARELAQTEADLRGGIELGIAAIRQMGGDMRSAAASVALPGRRISVRITNERARIDLNVANAAVLSGLFRASDVKSIDPAVLANALRDWRSGFDTGDGKSGLGRFIGQRVLTHPLQLTSIPNFSMEIVNAILPVVTVASGSSQIDPFIAPDRVLLSLPGTSAQSVQAFRDASDSDKPDNAIRALGAPQSALTADAASGWRLQILTTFQSGRRSTSEAIVALMKGDTEPYRVLYVVDDAERPLQLPAAE